jgi:integrase
VNGSVTKRARAAGKKFSWGYVFDAGRDEAGKRIQPTKSGFTTKREAEDALRQAIIEFEAKRDAGPASVLPTFSIFFDRWMKEHAGRKCAAKTIERYLELAAYAMRQIVDIAGVSQPFGEVTLDKFGPMHMELMVNALRDHGGQKSAAHPDGRPLSPKSVRHVASVVHGCFEKAFKWQLINSNPMARVELPVVTRKQPKVVEKDSAKKLLTRARGLRLYPFIMLSLASGARRGELLALLWSDIDFETGLMNVTKSLSQTKAGLHVKSTKSGRPRRFAVPAAALDALREHRAQQDGDRAMFGADYQENDLVFCQPGGAHYNPCSTGNRVSALMKSVGLDDVSLHSLRHTHASELLSNGVPIPTVAKRLGHANPNITLSIYAHAIEADELAAAKIWNDAMADVIDANKQEPKRMLANVSRSGSKNLEVVEKTA